MSTAPRDAAIGLDLLRITLSALLLISPEFSYGLASLKAPMTLGLAPYGFKWITELLGPSVPLGELSMYMIRCGALCGLLGVYARLGLALAALGQLYLIGWLQMRGATVHCHHLLWFTVALACVPCADSLRLGKRPTLACGPRYRLGLETCSALIAMVFFFPGLHKLTRGGWAWFSGETLHHTALWKAAQYWDSPIMLSFDERLSYAPLAWGAVLFELSAPLLLLWWRRRGLFLLLALSFHVGTALLLNIKFTNLWPCYVVLLPWERWAPRCLKRTEALARRAAPWRGAELCLLPLCLGVAFAGVSMRVNGWPFACYPTFHQEISREMPLLSILVQGARGETRRLDYKALHRPNNYGWSENWRLAGLYSKVSIEALHDYGRSRVAPLLTEEDQVVMFYRSSLNTNSGVIKDRRLLLKWIIRK